MTTTTKSKTPTLLPIGTKVKFVQESMYSDTSINTHGTIVDFGTGEFNYMRTVELTRTRKRVHASTEDLIQSDTRENALDEAMAKVALMAGQAMDLEAKSDRPSSAAMRAFALIEAAAIAARKL